jgi:hypothetical protein
VKISYTQGGYAQSVFGDSFARFLAATIARPQATRPQNSCRFVQDRAHAANDYDLRDAFEQMYPIMKSPDKKHLRCEKQVAPKLRGTFSHCGGPNAQYSIC